ncbi:TIGR03620 family F420-dependent LLM class oxidoreductase [soil metagenome]
MDTSRISLGVPGALDVGLIVQLAELVEATGFRTLWINDTADGDSLAGLCAAASSTTTLGLATGVIPVDRRSGAEIVAAAEGIDPARLVLGVGSGAAQNALARVSEAVQVIRSASTARVLVGALGPRMRRLAAIEADGVLLNWLTPQSAVEAMGDLRREGGPSKHGAVYVRTAVEASALPALQKEAAAYERYPSYAANFARIGATALECTIDGSDPSVLAARVGEYEAAVDEVVLRMIVAEPTLDDYSRFIRAVVAA